MTIDIERVDNVPVWYRTAGSDDPWVLLMASYAKMLPGQRWDLSQDGVERKGTLESFAEGYGGRWSDFIDNIEAHEVRRLGESKVYVHGN